MKIGELIKIIEKKILSQDCITKVKIEDKSFLHKNHKSNEKGKFHILLLIESAELKEKNKLWAIYDSTTDSEKKKQIKEIINKKKKKVAIDKSHPKSYKALTKKDILGFKNDGCLFARKIDKDAKITVNFN